MHMLYNITISLKYFLIGDTSATEPEAHVHNAGSHLNVQTQDDAQKGFPAKLLSS